MRSGVYETVECPSVRPSIHPSVCPIDRQQQRWPASLLLSAQRAGNIDRQLRALAPRTSCSQVQQQRRRSTALSSKCGQCHVDSRGTRMNTDLFDVKSRAVLVKFAEI